jgi:hypothetical protein
MSETVVVIEENTIVIEKITEGPQGPPGSPGVGAISADEGNAISLGSDGGLYCPAVISSTIHW